MSESQMNGDRIQYCDHAIQISGTSVLICFLTKTIKGRERKELSKGNILIHFHTLKTFKYIVVLTLEFLKGFAF